MADANTVLAQNASTRTENSLTMRTCDMALFSRLSEIHFRFLGDTKLGEEYTGINCSVAPDVNSGWLERWFRGITPVLTQSQRKFFCPTSETGACLRRAAPPVRSKKKPRASWP